MKLELAGLSLLVALTLCPNVTAQISSDGSLSTTVSTDDAVNFLIEGGERSLDNLFHSFSEFSIPNLGSAYFNNATDITNIFSRVTGGNISEIQGLIRANGTANLFLINPAGIVFGENAALDVGGSFFATTAESVVFGDGIEFSATQPQEAPLLTINITPGLQMGANSGNITVQNEGHTITAGLFFPSQTNETATGLQINPGNTLGLIAKEINLTGGIIRVPGGNIQLVGIEEGILNLNNSSQSWQLETSQVQTFGNINLSDKSLLDTSGFITDNIELQGRNVTIDGGSVLLIQNFGDQLSGNIIVKGTESVTLVGSVRNAPDQVTPLGTITGVVPSRLTTEAIGTRKGGNILVSGGNLFLLDGGTIATRGYGSEATGDISIDIEELVEITDYSFFDPLFISTITTIFFGSGDGGTINLSAQNLNINNGGSVASFHFGSGRGGDININLDEDLTISGVVEQIVAPTFLGSTSYRTGDTGRVTINVANLSVLDGAFVGTSSLAEGNADQLVINAAESVTISGAAPELLLFSQVSSNAPVFDITIRQALGVPDQPIGDSGNLIINTPNLTITELGRVSVSNEGLGNSGNVEINTNNIFLNTGGSITAFSASGQGGNINLNIEDYLVLRNSSAITAEATGTFANNQSVDGGNININSDLVTLLETSQINANAFEGNGGNITITTQGLFVTPDSSITASSQFGVDGTITLNTPDEENKLAIAELPANLTDASQQIVGNCSWTRDNTFYVVGRRGIAKTPQEHIQDYTMWSDIRDLNQAGGSRQERSEPASAQDARERRPREAAGRREEQERIVEANAWIINEDGNVELVAVVPSSNQNLGQVASSCSGEVGS